MTAPGDPGLVVWPGPTANKFWTSVDEQAWQNAKDVASSAAGGSLTDITGGATDYYAPASMEPDETVSYTLPNGKVTVFPKKWNQSAVKFTVEIANQLFFVDV
jgi:hypothetical protein